MKKRNPVISVRDFSRIIDIPMSTLSMLMRGTTSPTKSTIERVGRKLGWSSDDLGELVKLAVRQRKARRAAKVRSSKSSSPLRSSETSALKTELKAIVVNKKPRNNEKMASRFELSDIDFEKIAQLIRKCSLSTSEHTQQTCESVSPSTNEETLQSFKAIVDSLVTEFCQCKILPEKILNLDAAICSLIVGKISCADSEALSFVTYILRPRS